MTDEEIVCAWMEPDSILLNRSELRWHTRVRVDLGCSYCAHDEDSPIPLDLDALHEVEARLTDKHWAEYELEFGGVSPTFRDIAHATAAQKIAALAAVLRPEVEGR